MSEYEQTVKKALLQTALSLAAAIGSLLVVLVCIFKLGGHALKLGLLWSGAVMAISALIAQNRHSYFSALLTPNTFADSAFVDVLIRYRRFQSLGSWVFLGLAVIGVLIGTYGSLVE